MSPTTKVLVYQYRASYPPLVPDGLAVITVDELNQILQANPGLQHTRKPLPKGATQVEIHQHDLQTAEQQAAFADKPNTAANVADVKVPIEVMLGGLVGAEGCGESVVLSEKH